MPTQRARAFVPKNTRHLGQGMTEYIIVVALIAVAAVAAVSLFGASVKTQFTALASELVGGQQAQTSLDTQAQAADGALPAAGTAATLQDYADN